MIGIDITPLLILIMFVLFGAMLGGFLGALLIDRNNHWHWLARSALIFGTVLLGVFLGYWATRLYLAVR